MPNWCMNYLTVDGEEVEVEKFVNQIPRDRDGLGEDLFQKFVSIGNYNRDLAIDKWGTKWDVDEIDMSSWDSRIGRHDDGHTYSFYANLQTAWSPPVEAFTRISAKFPNLDFGLVWYETGMCFYGYCFMKASEVLARLDGELPDFNQLAEEKLDPRNSPYLGDQDVEEEASQMEYKFIEDLEDQLSNIIASNKGVTV